MTRPLLSLALLLSLSGVAGAQTNNLIVPMTGIQLGIQCDQRSPCGSSEVPDLDRAYAICEKHHKGGSWIVTYANGQPVSRDYADGKDMYGAVDESGDWSACNKVRELWNDGETAKAQRAAKEQDSRDLAFVKKIAEGK